MQVQFSSVGVPDCASRRDWRLMVLPKLNILWAPALLNEYNRRSQCRHITLQFQGWRPVTATQQRCRDGSIADAKQVAEAGFETIETSHRQCIEQACQRAAASGKKQTWRRSWCTFAASRKSCRGTFKDSCCSATTASQLSFLTDTESSCRLGAVPESGALSLPRMRIH